MSFHFTSTCPQCYIPTTYFSMRIYQLLQMGYVAVLYWEMTETDRVIAFACRTQQEPLLVTSVQCLVVTAVKCARGVALCAALCGDSVSDERDIWYSEWPATLRRSEVTQTKRLVESRSMLQRCCAGMLFGRTHTINGMEWKERNVRRGWARLRAEVPTAHPSSVHCSVRSTPLSYSLSRAKHGAVQIAQHTKRQLAALFEFGEKVRTSAQPNNRKSRQRLTAALRRIVPACHCVPTRAASSSERVT